MAAARTHWASIQARTEQLPTDSGDWQIWLYLAGRGAGKTRTAAEWIAWKAARYANTRWAVVAPTFTDGRDICFEGESGLIPILQRYGLYDKKNYNRSTGQIRLPNGSRIQIFSAEEPDRLRGPQHHGAWCDELASWRYPDTWDQLVFGLRLGERPQTIVTTTPRPTKIIKDLVSRDTTKVVRGSTFDNAANLAETALLEYQRRYAGTRLGRQELYGEILDDVPGALWTREVIESGRINSDSLPALVRVVVGVDPAVTSGEDSDSTGIVVAGMSADGNYYVLDDVTLKASPEQWAQAAIAVYEKHKADRIVAEVNNGGDLVIHLLNQVKPTISTKKVTASRGKRVRAEPVAAMYEQGRVHHVGYFAELETEMCEWVPDMPGSPDRMDALVWALTELSEGGVAMRSLGALAVFCPSCKMPAPRGTTVCPACGTKIGE